MTNTDIITDESGKLTDMVLPLPYAMQIRHLPTDGTDTQCRATLQEAVHAAYEAARVAMLSGAAYNIQISYQPTVRTETEVLHNVTGKSLLLEALRTEVGVA